MSTLPRSLEELQTYRNPEDVPLSGQNYMLLTKNCQHFAKYSMNRMIEGLWTDSQRPRDQNRFIDAEGDIARGQKVRHNLQRDASLFYLEEMSMWIVSSYSTYDAFADWQRWPLERKGRLDLRAAPSRILRKVLDFISLSAMYVFMLIVGLRGKDKENRHSV
jgi:hypothetical protein